LDGGSDGMKFYRKIIEQGHMYLSKKGFLVFEIHPLLKDNISNLLIMNKFKIIKINKDYNNLNRVILAQNEN
jgi:release factor glutamine methyltransferase